MDLGTFDKEMIGSTRSRYLVEISPSLNAKTFIAEADKIFRIAKYNLRTENFQLIGDELKQIYKNALLYFRGDERSQWNLDKGLFLCGSPGCGKSMFFNIFKNYTFELKHNSFVVSKQSRIVGEVAKGGIPELDKYIKDPKPITLYIDDFGAGNSEITHYGTTINIFDELIQARYDEFIKSGTLTHLTTNVTPAEIKTKFDERVYSRMRQMFNVINFPKNDYRK